MARARRVAGPASAPCSSTPAPACRQPALVTDDVRSLLVTRACYLAADDGRGARRAARTASCWSPSRGAACARSTSSGRSAPRRGDREPRPVDPPRRRRRACCERACRGCSPASCEVRHEPRAARRAPRRPSSAAPRRPSAATPTPSCAPTCGASRRWPAPLDGERLVRAAVARLDGFGTLDPLLADPTVDEVLVNAHGDVWVERDGRDGAQPATSVADDLAVVTERILAPLGRRLDRSNPIVDARLARRLARVRGDPAGVARRRVPVGAPLPRPLARPRRLRRRRGRRRARAAGRRPLQRDRQRGHVVGQDLAAQRHARVAARPASASSPSRTPSSCCRPPTTSSGSRPGRATPDGPRADLPRAAGAHRAAAPPRPPRRRRGPRAGGAGAGPGAEHRPRRVVVDVPRQQRARRAAPPGDAGHPGRAGVAARPRCASTSPARSTSSSTWPATTTAPAG